MEGVRSNTTPQLRRQIHNGISALGRARHRQDFSRVAAEAIINERQSARLSLISLINATLPMRWDEQRALFARVRIALSAPKQWREPVSGEKVQGSKSGPLEISGDLRRRSRLPASVVRGGVARRARPRPKPRSSACLALPTTLHPSAPSAKVHAAVTEWRVWASVRHRTDFRDWPTPPIAAGGLAHAATA